MTVRDIYFYSPYSWQERVVEGASNLSKLPQPAEVDETVLSARFRPRLRHNRQRSSS